jgi:hypothetical protein
VTSKKCSKCGEVKSLNDFHKCNKDNNGYKSRCKVCRNDDNRRRRLANKTLKEPVNDPRLNPHSRVCDECGVTKPLEEFNKSSRHKLGRMYKCKLCRNARLNKVKNKEKIRDYQREYKKINRERINEQNRSYRAKNLEKSLEKERAYRKSNKDRMNENNRKYYRNNPHISAKQRVKRRQALRQSTPSWSESEKISKVYKKAKELSELLGKEFHVDHIDPIMGENVCGLHVWANLQILESSLNCSKGNKENWSYSYEYEKEDS